MSIPTFGLSREDVLRELELLPVWKLRAPQNAAPPVARTISVTEMLTLPVTSSAATFLEVDVLPEQEPIQESALLAVLSEDHHYLFILEPDLSADAEALLQNMLRAMAVKPQTRIVSSASKILSEFNPKLLIAMGEVAAHPLLDDAAPFEQLRSKVHVVKELPLIATYSPTHLLSYPADKAKAWQDLCLAIATLEALSAQ